MLLNPPPLSHLHSSRSLLRWLLFVVIMTYLQLAAPSAACDYTWKKPQLWLPAPLVLAEVCEEHLIVNGEHLSRYVCCTLVSINHLNTIGSLCRKCEV